MEQRTISFVTDDGTVLEFYVEDAARVNGCDYLLLTDTEEDDANAWIFKDLSGEDSPEASYVPVEDEKELEALMKIFQEQAEDTDIHFS